MIREKKALALVPARGGSKRLPGKNTRPLNGAPLITFTIKAALRSRYVDHVMVSTDSPQIAEVARCSGAEVPFLRPERLSTDHASSVDVAIHALAELEARQMHFDYLILLQPTSPLRTGSHIDAAFDLLVKKEADAIVSVTELNALAEWSGALDADLQAPWLASIEQEMRGQQTSVRFRVNGAIYLIRTESLIEKRTFFLAEKIYGLPMEKSVSIDIDTRLDFDIAEFLMERNYQEGSDEIR